MKFLLPDGSIKFKHLMSTLSKYTNNVYHTQPEPSELSEGDVVLTKRDFETYIEYEEREVCTWYGTYYTQVPVEKTRYITVYYVVSAASYQRMLSDFRPE